MTHFPLLTKLQVRAALRKSGKNFGEINSIMDGWDDSLIPVAAAMLPPDHQDAYGALGDGSIIAKILEFLKSPAGQALIQILMNLLLGLI